MKVATSATSLTVFFCCLLPLLWIWTLRRLEDSRQETELTSLLQTVRVQQKANQRVLRQVEEDSERVVSRLFPGLQHNNSLPNFFLTPLQDRNTNYREGSIFYIDQPLEPIGGALSACFRSMAASRGLSVAPALTLKNRLLLDSLNTTGSVFKFKDLFKVYSGYHTFGACGSLGVPCSYLYVLREPLAAAVAAYEFCRENLHDMCLGVNVHKVSLRDWIIYQGSPVFRQLVTATSLCRNTTDAKNNTSVFRPEEEMLCHNLHRLMIENLSDLSVTSAVNYILRNFQNWFSVIGMAEDLPNTLQLFEHVYKLPFSKCDLKDASVNKRRTYEKDNSGHSDSSMRRQTDSWLDEEDPSYLVNDIYVSKALGPDIRIYREAKRLFRIQRQMLTNRIGS